MRTIKSIFWSGILVTVPIALSVAIVYWLVVSVELLLAPPLQRVIPEGYYWPGMGVLSAVLILFVVGVLTKIGLGRLLLRAIQALFQGMPIVKSIYGSLKDLMSFFARPPEREKQKTVMVKFGDTDMRLMGLVTRDDFSELPKGIGNKQTVAVYVPMSYQVGGFTFMVPADSVQNVDMDVEDSIRFTMTAGMSCPKHDESEDGLVTDGLEEKAAVKPSRGKLAQHR